MKVVFQNRRTIFGFVKEGLGNLLSSKKKNRGRDDKSPAMANKKNADDQVNRPSIVSARRILD